MDGIQTSIGMIELHSIARGYAVSDAMVKKAPVRLVESRAVTPGKYLVLVSGDVAEVDEAMRAGLAVAKDALIAELFLPQAHSQLAPLLRGEGPPNVSTDAMGIFELSQVAPTIVCADTAAKTANVALLELKLAVGIGGKGYFTLTGELYEVQAALEAAKALAGPWFVSEEIIARPHEDLTAYLRAQGRIG